MSPDNEAELIRVIEELRRNRREYREQYQRQQLMIDLVAFVLWGFAVAIMLQGVTK